MANGSFIVEKGGYRLPKGVLIDIVEKDDGLLNIRHIPTIEMYNITEYTLGIKKDSEWFIYIADYDEIWVASQDDLCMVNEDEYSIGCYSIFTDNSPETLHGHIFEKAPKCVLDRLHPSVTKRILEAQQEDDGPDGPNP